MFGLIEDFKERAIVFRGNNLPICLVKLQNKHNIWKLKNNFSSIPLYCDTKNNAIKNIATLYKINHKNIYKFEHSMKIISYIVRWDLRFDYFITKQYTKKEIKEIILSCKKLHHVFDYEGQYCEICGKEVRLLEKYKDINPKWPSIRTF